MKDKLQIKKDKPISSKEDQILYLKAAIIEATRRGNLKIANHYKMLLDFTETFDDASFNNELEELRKKKKGS